MHYYQFHIGDYKSHTSHLSHIEDLAYRRLLDFYYLHESPIKQRDIARQLGMKDYEQDVLTVLSEFFLSTEDGFVNPRADKEIKEYQTHKATSAFGAFIRENPSLKQFANKELFIDAYLNNKHLQYISNLATHNVPTMYTSKTHDATNTQYPLTTPNINTDICPPSGEPEDKLGFPKCNHQAVIDLYHQHLPTLRKVEVWNETRKGYLRQRWREIATEFAEKQELTEQVMLDYWARFFSYVAESKFLTGRVNDKSGRTFTADLEWILKPSNFAKIIEGKYHGV
jgi:uncharacterized protein YdaU (DUF1376 family)